MEELRSNALAKTEEKETTSKIAELDLQVAELKKELARLDAVANSKGIDPPCWYDEIEADDGRRIERAVPLFDVAVFDNHIVVRDRIPPERYAKERAGLPIGEGIFLRPVSDPEFREVMRPIRRMGKEDRRIRPYSCVFYVRVWDKTSPASKERWKQATEITIGNAFYRETVRTEPWERADDG
ncbi:hypothetical protein [Oceanibacterium hippocampi]|nr:hypothetical protein [Oceanibacterium hippocampi]